MQRIALLFILCLSSFAQQTQFSVSGGGSGSGGGIAAFCAATMSSNVLTCTVSPALTAYSAGTTIEFTSSANNTGSVQINVSALGNKNLYYAGSAMSSGSLPSGTFVYQAVYDGTQFQCLNCGNGYTYSYFRAVSQNTVGGTNFSQSGANNYNLSNSVQGSNSGLLSSTSSAWTYGTFPLPHNSSTATAQVYDFMVPLPPSWVSSAGLSFQLFWQSPVGTAWSGAISVGIRGQAVCGGSALGSYSSPIYFSASTAGTAGVLTLTTLLTGTTSDVLSGASANCMFFGQLFRDATHTGDTLNDTAASPTTDAQGVMLVVGTPGGQGGAPGAQGPSGASGSTTRALSWTFAGAAVSAGQISGGMTLPSASCTISGWDIDTKTSAGVAVSDTATIKVLDIASGTTSPGTGNSINTSGVSISTGSHVHSTTLSDFTSTTPSQWDVIAFDLYATGGVAGQVTFTLSLTGCQ